MTEPIDAWTARRVLAAPMPRNGADAATVADYLVALLSTLWRDEADFRGYAPFGREGWQHEVYEAMFRAGGFSVGRTDEMGVREVDVERADALVQAAIVELGALATGQVAA